MPSPLTQIQSPRRIVTLTCAGPGCTKTARIHVVRRVLRSTGKPVELVVRGAARWGYDPAGAGGLCPKCLARSYGRGAP
jgi:hypothetical protein